MFKSWYRKLFGQLVKPSRRVRRATRARLGFESLECRDVPTFLTPASFAAGANPGGVALGDFNNDGRPDMAVVSQMASGTVGILLGNGDGTFQPKVDYAAGSYAVDAKAGDFNADGKADLAVVGTQGSVSILLGNGDGSFAVPVAYVVGVGSHSINTGDFNGDGSLDVATMNSGTASVLLGKGDGTFQASRDMVIPGNSTNTVVGDFNRDGTLDLATSNTVSVGTITILKGHGDGSFDPASNVYAYSAPVYVGAGDFNNDGYEDFAVANSYAATSMSVILNNGDGTYAAPHTYSIPETGYEIEVADFNHDGNDDFAVRGSSKYSVQLGKGDGTFYPVVNYATPPGRFEMGTQGDFNGDGSVDFAYPSTTGVSVVLNAADDVSNLAGAVGFSVNVPVSTTSGTALPMTVSAVDASGNVVPGFRGTVYVTSNDPASPSAVAYTFTAADAGTHAFGGSVRLVTAGDQSVTVAAPFMTAATSTVTVTPAVTRFALGVPAAATAGDTLTVTVTALDSLGNVGTGYTSSVHFSSSDLLAGLPADYTFTPDDAGVHTFTVTMKSAGADWLAANEVGGTISGGSFVDVAAAATTNFTLAGGGGAIGVARPITVIARDDYGNLTTSYTGTVHVTSSDLAAMLPADITLVNGSVNVPVTLMTVGSQTITATAIATPAITGTMSSDATPPVASLFAITGFPATTAGVANAVTVTVRDTIGQIATGYTGTVYFSSSDAQAGLPASYTFTAADAGVHTFTATLRTAGTQSITARDATGTLTGTEVGIAVSPAAFAGFRLSVPNGADSKGHILVTAGDSIALTVRATDAFGNTVVGYKGKAKFSSTDILAALPADYNFTAADAGVHTFTVALKTTTPNATVWSFSVVDASNAATLGTLTNFEVTNAAASKFVLAVPSNITAGSPFSLKVTVLDAYGNKVKNYFGTVHFGNTAGIAGLPADYTFTGLDSGVQSFTITLNTTGNQTISVVDAASPPLVASVAVSVKAGSTGGGGGGKAK
ncbi:MAG: VCBS repeat-containing protein [Planctomycetes bacterium]|nr:VCBS repeat-containing protein [Planctomycetota bacterium]